MQGETSFERRGAPVSTAEPASAPWTASPYVDLDDVDLDDLAEDDLGQEDIAPRRVGPVEERPFRLRHWAVLAALSLLALGGTGVIILATVRQPAPATAQATAGLIPADQMPKSPAADMQKVSALADSYPEDPRIHALMAVSLAKSGAAGQAALELKAALDSPLLHAPEIPAGLEQHIRIMLFGQQLQLKQVDAARDTAQPLCPQLRALDPRVQHGLKLIHACDGR